MNKTMKAGKLVGEKEHKIITTQIPKISDDEVLVKVKVCGYCASELHTWKTGVYKDNDFLGHEVVGVIVEKGKNVSNYNIGDRVTGYILNGFAEYSKVHHSLITKVPDCLEDIEALG